MSTSAAAPAPESPPSPSSESSPARSPASGNKLATILRLRVPMVVQIGRRRMSFDDVLALGPGAILELDKSAEDKLELLVNNKPVGTGAAVKVGENFGIKIDRVNSPRQRISAMAPPPPEAPPEASMPGASAPGAAPEDLPDPAANAGSPAPDATPPSDASDAES